MDYPIFNSFVKQIENQLDDRSIPIKTFRTWFQDHINAMGLEIGIDVHDENNFVKEVDINLDWDRFREAVLARQFDGLQEHPMLQKNDLHSLSVAPKIDVELSWVFDEKKSIIRQAQLLQTSNWMEQLSKQVNTLLADDNVITRWHIEIEGMHDRRYLQAARLISYFQYSLESLKSLNDAHAFVKNRIQDIIVKSQKVRNLADDTLRDVA